MARVKYYDPESGTWKYADTASGSGSGDSVQPDWNQNDSAQPDYVKNRTHWEENNQVVIEWDGNFDDKPYVDVSDSMRLHKISDVVPTIGEAGIKITLLASTGETNVITIAAEDVNVTSEGAMFMSFTYGVMCVIVYGATVEGVDFSSIGPGTYLANDDYISGVTVTMDFGTQVIVHKLDEKFIPDTVARMEDIPEVPTSLPNPNKLIFSGGASGEYDGSEGLTVDIPATDKDWEQNDSTQPDYIKNRTHWEEYELRLIVSKTNWGMIPVESSSPALWRTQMRASEVDTNFPSACIGYVVEIDGVRRRIDHAPDNEYVNWDESGTAHTEYHWIGNGALLSAYLGIVIPNVVDTGDTFVFFREDSHYDNNGSPYRVNSYWYVSSVEATSVDIDVWDIREAIVHTLPEKFIPSTIARTVDIPSDAHINELINTALGVIENGSY